MGALFHSLIERVLQSENPRILLPLGGFDPSVSPPLWPPAADIVQLPHEVSFVDEMEEHLREARPPNAMLLLPPLLDSRTLSPEFRQRYRRRTLHEVALLRALDLVPNGTRVAVLLPVQFFASEIARSVREAIQDHLRVVMEHRHAWPGFHPSFRMHTVVFEKAPNDGEPGRSLLRFFRVPAGIADNDTVSTSEVTADLATLLGRQGGSTRWGYVLREGLPLGEPWVYDLYSPTSVALQEDLGELGGLRPLAELGEFVRTIHLAGRRGSLLDSEDDGGVPLLEGRNIRPGGQVQWEQTRYRICDSEALLRPGDICLRAILNPSAPLVSAQIQDDMPPVAAAHSLIVLRKKTETTEEEWQVLADYLQSPRAADLMAPRALGSIHLNRRALGELPVPVPDEALRVALRTLTEAAADFESWREETEQQKRALFGFSASREGRLHLMQAGKRARQRQRAGRSVDALAFRIRTQYPYPLAYRWRTVEARGKRLEDYLAVLDCGEATLCYLALLSIVGARVRKLRIGKVTQIGGQMAEQAKGIGLGDWVAVLREVGTSKLFRDLKSFPFPEVPTVLTNEDTDEAVQRLQEARNDQAHGRGPKGAEVAVAIENRCADLEVLLQSVEFLVEYPLRLIEETRRDSLSELTRIGFRDLMGDHPLVPLVADHDESSEIEAGSLYFVDRNGRYHLARPWLSWRVCPECQRPATFHVDHYDRKQDAVILKSLEHGHTMVDRSTRSVLRGLGFLP